MSLICIVLSACSAKELYKNLDARQEQLANDTSTSSLSRPTSQTLTWNDALKRLQTNNNTLLQAKRRLEDLERADRQHWRTWLPSPNANVSLQTSLFELSTLTSESLSASVFAPLRIPNPIDEKARRLQSALQIVQARDSLKITERRLIQRLYRLFEQWEDVTHNDESTNAETSTLEEQIREKIDAKQKDLQERERRGQLHRQLSQILDIPNTNIAPISSTRPTIDYSQRIHKLTPGKNYGKLAVRLSSYEIEAAILRRRGIKVASFPRFSSNLNTPALFDNRRTSREFGFEAEEIRLFTSVNKTFDLSGRVARSAKTAEENVKLVQNRVKLNISQESRRWRALKERYALVLEQKALLSSRLKSLLSRSVSSAGIPTLLSEMRAMRRQLESLNTAKNQMDLEIWIWDDSRWEHSSL